MTFSDGNMNWGMESRSCRSDSVLTLQSNGRDLFKQQLIYTRSYEKRSYPEEAFTEEKEAVEELLEEKGLSDQSGEGILDIAQKALEIGGRILPGASPRSTLGKAASAVGKIGKVIGIAKQAAEIGSELAFGKVGTAISNKLSERFNNNPKWRPGFAGEQHLVLMTKYGLTRANYCGPKTSLLARLNRLDEGVSQIDDACKKHDMLYHLAKSVSDIRAADNQMITDVRKATDSGATQKAIIIAGLKAKKLGENVGIFGPETFTSIPGLHGSGHAYDERFINGSSRDIRGIMANTVDPMYLSDAARMGGNGIISRPGIFNPFPYYKAREMMFRDIGGSGFFQDLARAAKTVGRTVSKVGQQVLPIAAGLGIQALQQSPAGALVGPVLGMLGPSLTGGAGSSILGSGNVKMNDPTISNLTQTGAGVIPYQVNDRPFTRGFGSRDESIRKSIDPTIRNMIGNGQLNPAGGGLITDIAKEAEKLVGKPADKLRAEVEKILRRKRTKRLGKRGLKIVRRLASGKELKKWTGLNQNTLIRDISRLVKQQTGGEISGGQILPFAGAASMAAKFIIPQLIKAIRGNMRGLGPGSALASKLKNIHGIISPASLGLSVGTLQNIIKVMLKKQRGRGYMNDMKGGQFGILAGLAASIILPKIITLVKKNL